jgi:hypothetical protein
MIQNDLRNFEMNVFRTVAVYLIVRILKFSFIS